MSALIVTIPGGTPEQLKQAHAVAIEFFRSLGITPDAAAEASFQREGFHDLGIEEYEHYDKAAAAAWDDVIAAICKACGVKSCEIELP